MNGRSRDSATADIANGHPTLSAEADLEVTKALRFMDLAEQEAFARSLDGRVAQSPAWAGWLDQPSCYLVELDAETVAEIEAYARAQLGPLRHRAAERGWELPD